MARHLLEAICSGDEQLAKNIILSGSCRCLDSQTSKRDGTALFFCCSRGLLELVTLLVNRGASLESRTKLLATPLHAAVDNNHLDVVRYLLDMGANLNPQTHRGDTPLHLAAYRGYTDIVHLLVQWGADVTVANEFHVTPLNEAILQGHCDIERYLQAIQDLKYPSHSPAPSSCHMVNIPSPTDLPSIFPSQYESNTSPSSQPTSPKDFFHQPKRPLHQSPTVGPHSSASPNPENYHYQLSTSNAAPPNPGQRVHPSRECLDHYADGLATSSSELSGRVPEERTDPSVRLCPLAVPTLSVPFYDRATQRRNSSASSISMVSDCSNSGPRSDDSSCAMSSISDVSSCGGDARREDFEASDLDTVNRTCGLVVERRRSQPLSTTSSLSLNKPNESLISRTYSNPAPNSIGEFSDLFDSSLFSLGSLGSLDNASSSSSSDAPLRSLPRGSIPSSDYHVHPVNRVKDSRSQSFNCLTVTRANNLSQPMTKGSVHVKDNNLKSHPCFNDATSFWKQNRVPPVRPPMERGFQVSITEDCPTSLTWSLDNQPSNDLSSVRSSPSPSSTSPSSCTPSMTFINIPVHE